MADQKWGLVRLPVTEKKLQEEIDRYFEQCGESGAAPTPSGLALALGVRTKELADRRLSPVQKSVISRAMQRIEADMMEMLVAKGGVKGVESVLERMEQREEVGQEKERIRALTDEELMRRLKRMEGRIREMVGQAEKGE